MVTHPIEGLDSSHLLRGAPLAPGGPSHLLPGARAQLAGGDPEPLRPRIGAALPDDALALEPPIRLGWPAGTLCVRELPHLPPSSLPPTATLAELALRMREGGGGWVAIAHDARLSGAVSADAMLAAIARGQLDATARELLSTQVPSCTPEVRVVDALRTMLDTHTRQLPIVDEGHFIGLLPLSVAAASAERDPAVRDVLESEATRPALFARPWW